MLWLALKTLFHEKIRLAITLIGITVSAVLVLVQVAIYLGSMGNATAIIRHTDADLWVTSRNIQTFDFALPFSEEVIDRVRAMREVARAGKILLAYGNLKLPDGGLEQVQMIGYNPDTGLGAPWSMRVGRAVDVKGGNFMILDESAEPRLGRLSIGSNWELDFANKPQSFKLVGLSQGIRSFTTSPIVFMDYNALSAWMADVGWPGQTAFIVAKLRPGADASRVAAALRRVLPDNDVLTREGFIAKSVEYWTIETGLGMAFFLTALLATVIGGSIVGQTIYASTIEHLREFGTLKAIGARNGEIYQIIFSQAVIGAIAGYGLATAIVLSAEGALQRAGVPFYLSPALFGALFVVLLLACLGSAYFSVGKIRTLDPVSVFKG
ncbi:MAG: ABC transporter permease [Betaproteobacteria bacterium]|nr:ABC transporter permease [Betaproteobacteria bacterium]